MKKVFFK